MPETPTPPIAAKLSTTQPDSVREYGPAPLLVLLTVLLLAVHLLALAYEPLVLTHQQATNLVWHGLRRHQLAPKMVIEQVEINRGLPRWIAVTYRTRDFRLPLKAQIDRETSRPAYQTFGGYRVSLVGRGPRLPEEQKATDALLAMLREATPELDTVYRHAEATDHLHWKWWYSKFRLPLAKLCGWLGLALLGGLLFPGRVLRSAVPPRRGGLVGLTALTFATGLAASRVGAATGERLAVYLNGMFYLPTAMDQPWALLTWLVVGLGEPAEWRISPEHLATTSAVLVGLGLLAGLNLAYRRGGWPGVLLLTGGAAIPELRAGLLGGGPYPGLAGLLLLLVWFGASNYAAWWLLMSGLVLLALAGPPLFALVVALGVAGATWLGEHWPQRLWWAGLVLLVVQDRARVQLGAPSAAPSGESAWFVTAHLLPHGGISSAMIGGSIVAAGLATVVLSLRRSAAGAAPGSLALLWCGVAILAGERLPWPEWALPASLAVWGWLPLTCGLGGVLQGMKATQLIRNHSNLVISSTPHPPAPSPAGEGEGNA